MAEESLFEMWQHLNWQEITPSPGETIQIHRVSTYEGGAMELAFLVAGSYSPHVHDNTDSHLVVFEGRGDFFLDGTTFAYRSGSQIYIPRGAAHGLEVAEPTLLLSMQEGEIYGSGLDYRVLDS